MVLTELSLLVIAGLVALPLFLARVSTGFDRLLTRLGMLAFGDAVDDDQRKKRRRRRLLRSAHVPKTYRHYAVDALAASLLAGVAAGILGLYVTWGVFAVLSTPPATANEVLPEALEFLSLYVGQEPPTGLTLLGILSVVGLSFGVGTAASVYGYRWYYPQYVADARKRRIEVGLPMTVSFIYALSRSGMAFPKIMRILSENRNVYGEAADEVGVAVRNIEVFGMDVITAVKTMARRSPSPQFREFSENLSSVLQTGGSLSEFLHRQYEDYREEEQAQQDRLLELLETIAEAYVTVFVAGALFLITILVVIAIAIGDALPLLRLIVYAIIPLGNLGFIVYLSTVVENISQKDPSKQEVEVDMEPRGVRRSADLTAETAGKDGTRDVTELASGQPTADGGTVRESVGDRVTRQRLRAYKGYREVRRRLGSPIQAIVQDPTRLLWISFPVAVFLVGIRIPAALSDRVITVAEFDDLLIQSTIFLFGTFAVAYEVHRRRIEAIERTIPDFLDRLASLNEAGMSVVESLEQIRSTELGPLDDELDVVWADIRWGSDVETALRRFENRVRTKTISRITTLITEAMKASGNLGTVLRIAANQAKADRRLKAERRQEMLTYLVVVYISFFVFLIIVGILDNVLIPSLPDTGGLLNGSTTGGTGDGPQSPVPALSNVGSINEEAYRMLFLHTTVIQGVFSGLVAGQLSTGDVKAGAKHVTIMVATGYLAFLLFL